MSAETILEAVYAINPRTVDRAKRLLCAVQLLNTGLDRREVTVQIRQRFKVSQPEAWRIVDLATDMASTPAAAGAPSTASDPRTLASSGPGRVPK